MSSAPNTPSAAPSTSPQVPDGSKFCLVDRPSDWQLAERNGIIAARPGEKLRLGAVGADGSTVFAISETADKTSLVMINKGKRTTVFTVRDNTKSQLGTVRFDGDWLVFERLLGFDIDATWELYAWNPSNPNADPERIARRAKNTPTVSFFRFDLRAGLVTWMQPNTLQARDIHLYDLESGKDHVLAKKMIFAPMLVRESLIWQEQNTDESIELRGVDLEGLDLGQDDVDLEEGPATAIPAALNEAGGSFEIATDGTTWAWNSSDFTKLYAWREGWTEPITVRDDGLGNHFQYVAVGDGLITYTDDQATFAADLDQHSYAPITETYGGAVTNGTAIAVSYPSDDSKVPGLLSYVMDTATVDPLPTC